MTTRLAGQKTRFLPFNRGHGLGPGNPVSTLRDASSLDSSGQASSTTGDGGLPADDVDQALAEAVADRGRQPNMSFFAFTATPKGKTLESTLRTAAGSESGEVVPALETAVLETVAAFANSRDGGTLLVGVADDGTVHGLAGDYASLHQSGKDDRDRFGLHLGQLLVDALGEAAASTVSARLHTVEGRDLCRVHVPPSSFPVEAEVKVDKGGQLVKKTAFYVRIGNGTREITDPAERQKYLASRWGAGTSDSPVQ